MHPVSQRALADHVPLEQGLRERSRVRHQLREVLFWIVDARYVGRAQLLGQLALWARPHEDDVVAGRSVREEQLPDGVASDDERTIVPPNLILRHLTRQGVEIDHDQLPRTSLASSRFQ